MSARHRCRISGLADARGARHSVVRKASPASFEPVWLKGPAEEIKEAATRQVLQTIQQVSLEVPGLRNKVNTTFVGPGAYTGSADGLSPAQVLLLPQHCPSTLDETYVARAVHMLLTLPVSWCSCLFNLQPSACLTCCHADDALPIVFVPSFDSSLVEYRRLLPVLASAGVPAFAVDVVGWGFTEAGFATDPTILLGPQQKRDHLYAFWKEKVLLLLLLLQSCALCASAKSFTCRPRGFFLSNPLRPALPQIKRPMVVAGVSLGGAVALDFAVSHPEAVAKLVLVDAQVGSGVNLLTACSHASCKEHPHQSQPS